MKASKRLKKAANHVVEGNGFDPFVLDDEIQIPVSPLLMFPAFFMEQKEQSNGEMFVKFGIPYEYKHLARETGDLAGIMLMVRVGVIDE